ncbi:hypothetical protein AJ80_06605 [Polytolypa hystricis UAMH7299]|uniref:F-box domain-containing protein n=1 Tax=Polytolypa hystricis (strain UAMH7299) TaxID=1447883 RepID=A0A2B7XVJ7_POLH7|nr:hypothetical protein AJ80_06605 [Polytolypa hystricis UAMH7299]
MILSDLPVEILLSVGDNLPSVRHLNALVRTSRRLYEALNSYLYRRNVRYHDSSALGWAVRAGEKETARHALDAGANLHAKDKCSYHKEWAQNDVVCEEHDSLLLFLLERGANVNTTSQGGWTPLHKAVLRGNEVLVHLLIENGADINAKDNIGQTVLHLATSGGCEAIARFLIEKSVSIRAVDNSGRTPLYEAVQRVEEATVRLLVDNGAGLNTRDNCGSTPLLALTRIRFFSRHRASVYRFLIEKGADIEARNSNGATALHILASPTSYRSTEIQLLIRMLIENGANTEVTDDHGVSITFPLACRRGNLYFVDKRERWSSPRLAKRPRVSYSQKAILGK